MLVVLSPKLYKYDVGDPVDRSVKETLSGTRPFLGDPVKLAIGVTIGAFTVI